MNLRSLILFFMVLFFFYFIYTGCASLSNDCLTDYNCPINQFCVHRQCTTKNPISIENSLPTEKPQVIEHSSVSDISFEHISEHIPESHIKGISKERVWLDKTNHEPQFDNTQFNDAGTQTEQNPTKELVIDNDQADCVFELAPSSLDFKTVLTGLYKDLTVAVTLLGNSCKVKSIVAIGVNPQGNSAFKVINLPNFPVVLKKGQKFLLKVRFIPLSAFRKTWQAKVQIHTNDKLNSIVELAVKGETSELQLVSFPSSLDFGTITSSCKVVKKVAFYSRIYNKLNPPNISISKLSFSSNSSSSFKIKNVPALPQKLNFGEKFEIEIEYNSNSLQSDSATLEVFINNDTNSFLQIPIVGTNQKSIQYQEVFKQQGVPKVDILFAIDFTTGGMRSHQQFLKDNLKLLFDDAKKLNADYQIAVVEGSLSTLGRNVNPGCMRGQIKIVSPNVLQPLDVLQSNIPVTTAGGYPLAGLDVVFRALSLPIIADSSCNLGFLRKDALLSVLFVSGYNDESHWPTKFYEDFFLSLKGNQSKSLVKLSYWGGFPPNGCRSANAGAKSSPKYFELTSKFSGVQKEICSLKQDAMRDFSSLSFSYRTSFGLMRIPISTSISVEVNKNPMLSGWKFDFSTNSIVFDKSNIPPPNSAIVVKYNSRCQK